MTAKPTVKPEPPQDQASTPPISDGRLISFLEALLRLEIKYLINGGVE